MNNKYYKTKFCNNFIEKGICLNIINCCYAHSLEEIRHVKCHYYTSCNKVECNFLHNYENIDEYRKRINFVIPIFKKIQEDDDDEDIEVIIDPSSINKKNIEENIIQSQPNRATFRPIELERDNEMSYYWGLMATWSKRDIIWK